MKTLAIQGGEKIKTSLFPEYRVIDEQEEQEVFRVLQTGVLSKFLGCWKDDFFGGPEVRALEEEWATYFNVKHAISVNSATSGLYCAVGATGVGPGDEVIVSPYTMSASATAALIYNAIPVFADVEGDFFCLDPKSIEERITERTKAIIVVDILGQPYDADAINEIARKHNLIVIEDAAQAPGACYNGRYAGTLGDIGIFSLNYHKHIHSGEGGIVVTNDDDLAQRIRLIRNHAEAVVEDMKFHTLINMVGFNFRMTELEAVIARQQLKKLEILLTERRRNVEYLSGRLSAIPCLEPAKVRPGCDHSFYVHPIKYNEAIAEIPRNIFIEAVRAELAPTVGRESDGVLIGCGYVKPLYLQPLYQKQIAFGDKGCPFACPLYQGSLNYRPGICPTCEKLHYEELITHELMRPPMTMQDLDDVFNAFFKVWENREELK